MRRRTGEPRVSPAPSGIPTTDEISIYISSISGLDTGIEYAAELRRQGRDPMICLDPRIGAEAEEILQPLGEQFIRLPSLSPAERLVSRFHRNLISTATSFLMGGNPNYRIIGPAGGPQSEGKERIYRSIRRFPWWPSARRWNRLGPRLFSSMHRRRFPTDHVLAVSSAANPLFLCARGLHVDTIVDSWDHPVRKVAGYPTRLAIAWNDDLAHNWIDNQGAHGHLTVIPRRLRYALESPQARHGTSDRPVLLYPVATSTNIPELFADELRLLDRVMAACRAAGWDILVKPRPDAIPNSLRDLVSPHSHATLGVQLNSSGGALDYRLTAEYNKSRLSELASVDLVLSTVTTFGLDAACAHRPILQLDPRGLHELPALSAISFNYHLRQYLYQLPGTLSPASLVALERQLADVLGSGRGLKEANSAQEELRDWILGTGHGMTELVSDLLLSREPTSSRPSFSDGAQR